MDEVLFILHNPVTSVQLIPIINYLNLLSEFLFTKNYLAEVNQHKQIPIVNALYEYLEENRDDTSKNVKLIRHLLQGSDLYGAKDSEELNVVFVNTMFDYIISSLVFDKYGNIYGFLADVVRGTENLQYDHVLMVIKETLRNATFENEYGDNSILTPLAVDRIHNDIISPLFPQPNANLNLLSLDYIFAQAGSMYLRLGKINNTYFSDIDNSHNLEIKNDFRNVTLNNFSDELAMGHLLGKLIQSRKVDPRTVRVFALPALFYYCKNKLRDENTRKVIFNPAHWKAAHHDLFEFLDNAFDRIEDQLLKDYIHKIHLAFLHFQNYAAMANFILDLKCRYLNEYRESKSMSDAEKLECPSIFVLPNITEFQNQIDNVGQIFGDKESKITEHGSKFLVDDFRHVVITLLFTNNGVDGNSNNSSLDLLEFYYTEKKTSDYYALMQENNTVTLIKDSDDPEYFRQKVGPHLSEVIKSGHRTILKNADENTQELVEKLVKYKRRLNSDLRYSDNKLKNNEWWKKFGLSLVPSNHCSLKVMNQDVKNNLCEKNDIKFINEFQKNESSEIHNDTESFLFSLGTTIKTVFLRDLITAIVQAHENISLSQNIFSDSFNKRLDAVYDSFSLHIEEPAFASRSTTKEDVKLLSTILDDIENNIDSSFGFVRNMLDEIKLLKTALMKTVGDIGDRKKRLLFVNAGKNDTGFGYKFIIIGISNGTVVYAQLRTGYDFKDEILITPSVNHITDDATNFSKSEKTYLKLNMSNFEIEPYYIYEINNRLRKKSVRVLFSGISTYYKNDDRCDDFEYLLDKENRKNCMRHVRFVVKTTIYQKVAIELLRRRGILRRSDFTSEHHVRDLLKMYTFPNESSFLFFFEKWLINSTFDKSDWSDKNIVDKSGFLRKLRYDVRLGNCNVSFSDGKSGIDSIYTYRERQEIEDGKSLQSIIQDYNEQKACYSVTFEDYYAIRNFATTGSTRITGDTNEAKLMKIALYKLAVRQFEDLGEGFELKLFRFDSKPKDFVKRQLFVGQRVVLQKFTQTSISDEAATRFGGYPAMGCENVLYEINFNGSYFRARIETNIERFESAQEKQIILLPGTEFIITEIVTLMNIGGIGNATKVVLTSTFSSMEKYEWYKKIMRKITQINL